MVTVLRTARPGRRAGTPGATGPAGCSDESRSARKGRCPGAATRLWRAASRGHPLSSLHVLRRRLWVFGRRPGAYFRRPQCQGQATFVARRPTPFALPASARTGPALPDSHPSWAGDLRSPREGRAASLSIEGSSIGGSATKQPRCGGTDGGTNHAWLARTPAAARPGGRCSNPSGQATSGYRGPHRRLQGLESLQACPTGKTQIPQRPLPRAPLSTENEPSTTSRGCGCSSGCAPARRAPALRARAARTCRSGHAGPS